MLFSGEPCKRNKNKKNAFTIVQVILVMVLVSCMFMLSTSMTRLGYYGKVDSSCDPSTGNCQEEMKYRYVRTGKGSYFETNVNTQSDGFQAAELLKKIKFKSLGDDEILDVNVKIYRIRNIIYSTCSGGANCDLPTECGEGFRSDCEVDGLDCFCIDKITNKRVIEDIQYEETPGFTLYDSSEHQGLLPEISKNHVLEVEMLNER